ncbi:MAG: bifunctional folylpolyglutamate synthase/dihydrofolate synthase [Phototrophicales bacterium]|nr:MAG: bifunctional folylpolyglutamate synthase/dihydrofolate synthase [Phototrophicales bacterium]
MLTYPQAIDVLNALIEQSRFYPIEQKTARANTVQRTSQLLTALDIMPFSYPIIHVTGTKGKGSVSAMITAILQAAGYRVGLYTSPHLQDFRERIQVNGELANPDLVAALVSQMQPIMNTIAHLRWFEAVTALALSYFQHESVDVAVVEVGVGGRYDATNVVQPILSIITSISYDHISVLGETLTEIATEKAGIIKPNIPVVSAPQPREASLIIEHRAQQVNAPLHMVGRDSYYFPAYPSLSGQAVEIINANGRTEQYKTALIGKHQAINTAVVVAAVQQLNKLGWKIAPESIDRGLANVRWPARFELLEGDPLLVIDAAHNQSSAGWLAKTLTQLFPEHTLTLVFGAMSDKDVEGMLKKFIDKAQHFVLTQARSGRAMSPEQLQTIALSIGIAEQQITLAESVEAAITFAKQRQTQLLCICGSLYVVGEARDVLGLSPAPLLAYSGQQAE